MLWMICAVRNFSVDCVVCACCVVWGVRLTEGGLGGLDGIDGLRGSGGLGSVGGFVGSPGSSVWFV